MFRKYRKLPKLPTKYCIDCKYYVKTSRDNVCTHVRAIDRPSSIVVLGPSYLKGTGAYVDCETMRHYPRLCGFKARYWEAKDVSEEA